MTQSAADMELTTSQRAQWSASLLSGLLASTASAATNWLSEHEITPASVRWLHDQGLASFVYFGLHRMDLLHCLSEPARRDLQATCYLEKAQSILLQVELDSLLADLRRTQVEPIVLKGMALALTVFPAPFTRPMADIDLWIDHAAIETVRQVFADRGYHEMGLQNERLTAFPSHLHAWREYPGGQRVTVEAHWNLFHEAIYRDIDLTAVRARARHMVFEDRSIWVLDPIDHLLHACGHLLVHHSYAWITVWLLDLRIIVETYGADWDWPAVVTRAQELRLAGALVYWLETAEEWCGPFLASGAVDAMTSIVPDQAEVWYLNTARAGSRRIWQIFRQRGRGLSWRAQINLYWQILFPPWTYMQYRYHARTRWLAPFYYAWRLLRAAALTFRRTGDFEG
jgi:hypothetical protein